MREIMDIELEPTLGSATIHSAAEVRGLMEIEFEEAQREKSPTTLMRVRIEDFERLAPRPDRRSLVLCAVLAGVRAAPRGGDLLACREGDDLVVLLPRTSPEAAEAVARASIENARKLTVPGANAPQRASLCIGLAHAQSDLDLYFETLLQVAEEGLTVASNSGGETFIHTQLYGLFQRQIERVRGPRPPPSAAQPKSAGVPAKLAPVVSSTANVRPAPSSTTSAVPAIAALPVIDSVSPVNGVSPDPVFEASIKSAFSAESRGQGSLGNLEGRVLELARTWAQDALVQAMNREKDRHHSEIDLYERRIQKLTQSLAETETELRRMANLKALDPGVASAFRSVQGIGESESQYATKLTLLSKILQANLELRAQLGGAAPAT